MRIQVLGGAFLHQNSKSEPKKVLRLSLQYMIQGSANINQRSMDGGRDTELAVGAYQPAYLCHSSDARLARGEVSRVSCNGFVLMPLSIRPWGCGWRDNPAAHLPHFLVFIRFPPFSVAFFVCIDVFESSFYLFTSLFNWFSSLSLCIAHSVCFQLVVQESTALRGALPQWN